jgi:uncharacterized protein YbaA (DUF1428 family)
MLKWKIVAVLGLTFGLTGVTWGLAQQRPDKRYFELRIYTAQAGKMDPLVARFGAATMRLFERHGMTNVGYWTATSGDNADRTLIYLMAYPSKQARDASWKAFGSDPDWKQLTAETQKDGPLIESITSRELVPTDYSPLK